MGSIDKACISGFLCRLCSEMHRTVIHIYGDQGQRHGLVEKINGYLPVTITPTDPLPKTICENCWRRVEEHHELLIRINRCRELANITRPERDRERQNSLPNPDADLPQQRTSDDDSGASSELLENN